jgi:hypothetical protein
MLQVDADQRQYLFPGSWHSLGAGLHVEEATMDNKIPNLQ